MADRQDADDELWTTDDCTSTSSAGSFGWSVDSAVDADDEMNREQSVESPGTSKPVYM